jgi:hypothetical protein
VEGLLEDREIGAQLGGVKRRLDLDGHGAYCSDGPSA